MKKSDSTAFWVFAGLVAFGVVGRWLQPDWNFAPTAAVAAFAAWWFASSLTAVLAPVAVMAISNLLLDDYQGAALGAVIYAAYLIPVGMGRLLRAKFTWPRVAALCVVSPVSFYLITNFAHWALLHQYPHTLAGLTECYARALPFLRGTAMGDVCYVALLFGGYAILAERLSGRWTVGSRQGIGDGGQ